MNREVTHRLKACEVLFNEGDPPTTAFLLESGRLRITARSDDGERVLAEIGPGELVGEMAVIDQSPRTARPLPPNPGVRFSRDGLSSQLFPHRDWRASSWAEDIVNSPRLAKKAFGHCL